MRLLLDHTTLHGLTPIAKSHNGDLPLRGLLQLIEELFLADEIGVSNTEPKSVLDRSLQLINELDSLRPPEASAAIKVYDTHEKHFVAACRDAAIGLLSDLDHLALDGAIVPELRKRVAQVSMPLRPEGTTPVRLAAVYAEAIEWDTHRRETIVDRAISEKAGESTFLPFLLNERLFRIGAILAKEAPIEADPLETYITTLCRWHINRCLASIDSEETNGDRAKQYAPAYGRSMLLGSTCLSKRASALHLLNNSIWSIYQDIQLESDHRAVYPSLSVPIPVIGAAALLNMPRSINLSDLLNEIAKLRVELHSLRDWITGNQVDVEIPWTIESLEKRILKKAKYKKGTLRARLSIIWGLPKFELISEHDISALGHTPISRNPSLVFKRPHVTVLTSVLEPLLRNKSAATELQLRAESLLRR